MKSRVCAACSAASSAAAIAASSKTVLIGISWIPIRSYSSRSRTCPSARSLRPHRPEIARPAQQRLTRRGVGGDDVDAARAPGLDRVARRARVGDDAGEAFDRDEREQRAAMPLRPVDDPVYVLARLGHL